MLQKIKQSLFCFKKSVCFSIPVFKTTSKNMKKFVSEIFKRTTLGKLYTEESSHIEGCVNPNIQDKYNLTHKDSSVDYADMLLTLKKCRVKIKAVLSAIGIVEKHEGITCRSSTR